MTQLQQFRQGPPPALLGTRIPSTLRDAVTAAASSTLISGRQKNIQAFPTRHLSRLSVVRRCLLSSRCPSPSSIFPRYSLVKRKSPQCVTSPIVVGHLLPTRHGHCKPGNSVQVTITATITTTVSLNSAVGSQQPPSLNHSIGSQISGLPRRTFSTHVIALQQPRFYSCHCVIKSFRNVWPDTGNFFIAADKRSMLGLLLLQ